MGLFSKKECTVCGGHAGLGDEYSGEEITYQADRLEAKAGKEEACISLEGQKVFYSGYDPKEKDLHDMKILKQLTT